MNTIIFFGIVLIILGLSGLAISQFLLHKWIKKFNKEWMDKK